MQRKRQAKDSLRGRQEGNEENESLASRRNRSDPRKQRQNFVAASNYISRIEFKQMIVFYIGFYHNYLAFDEKTY
jgi:hypothetical protein